MVALLLLMRMNGRMAQLLSLVEIMFQETGTTAKASEGKSGLMQIFAIRYIAIFQPSNQQLSQ
nr:MAG TPA_asm: hypothetical protein [Caudoviricetes sp.]